jgi:septum site-determining protein MinC
MAFVLAPQTPLNDWLAELDRTLQQSQSFFAGRPIVLDLAGLALGRSAAEYLISNLEERKLRLIAVEGAEGDWLPPRLAPLPPGAQTVGVLTPKPDAKPQAAPAPDNGEAGQAKGNILIEESVRSGQLIINPEGDVTVIGSVASGAEIIAAGSIHVYGHLRGRVFAGTNGNPKARIFCSKFDAEILAIDGLYKTADDFDRCLSGTSVQARLDHDVLNIQTMN